ncbi:dynein intermediate chain, putative [Plasmodium vivax]|nr:dynein intermediate chain, putative [Plasmodium vivax]
MKANAVEKKKKKKLQAVGGEAKGAEGDGLENEKRKASIQNGKNETFTRFLFPKNPRAFANLVEFSFSNEEFTSVDQVDHTVFHLDMQSCLVMRDSDEGRKQVELVKKKIEKANSFTVLKDNDYVYHKPKNCFDYIDRYAQTVPVSFK